MSKWQNPISKLPKQQQYMVYGGIGVFTILAGVGIYRAVKRGQIRRDLASAFGETAQGSSDEDKITAQNERDQLNQIHVDRSGMTLSSAQVARRVADLLDGFNCSWGCIADGTDEGAIKSALGVRVMPIPPSLAKKKIADMGGNVISCSSVSCTFTTLSKDDIKAIFRKFGMRTYSHWNGGTPSKVDDITNWAIGQNQKLNLWGWIRAEMSSSDRKSIAMALRWAGVI